MPFKSQINTEVVAQLVSHLMDQGLGLVAAVEAALPCLHSAFASSFLLVRQENFLIGARHGSPLAVGLGRLETYLDWDALARAPFTDEITYLEEGDCAVLFHEGAENRDLGGAIVRRPRQRIATQAFLLDKGNHRHFIEKKIYKRPKVVGRTLAHHVAPSWGVGHSARGFDLRRRPVFAALDHSLRHRLLRRPDRQVVVQDPGAAAARDRCRLQDPLPRVATGARRTNASDLSIGRDRPYPGLARLR